MEGRTLHALVISSGYERILSFVILSMFIGLIGYNYISQFGNTQYIHQANTIYVNRRGERVLRTGFGVNC